MSRLPDVPCIRRCQSCAPRFPGRRRFLFRPEYAGALPGGFKNLLDWTVGGGDLYRKPVAWVDVSSSATGAASARVACDDPGLSGCGHRRGRVRAHSRRARRCGRRRLNRRRRHSRTDCRRARRTRRPRPQAARAVNVEEPRTGAASLSASVGRGNHHARADHVRLQKGSHQGSGPVYPHPKDLTRGEGVMHAVPLTRRVRRAGKRFREVRMLIRAFRFPYRPVAAHLIPIRRCNLSCAYCNEYDEHSLPVPTPSSSAHRSSRRPRHRHRDAERRGTAAASRSRRDHPPYPWAGRDRDAHHEWLSASVAIESGG